MKSRAEEFAEWGTEVVFGRARGFRAWMMRCLLRFASFFFWILVQVRLFLFRRRLKRTQSRGLPMFPRIWVTARSTERE